MIPGKLADIRRSYARDCVPTVKDAPGNLDAYLMEPTDADGPVVACTIWKTEEDAQF